MKTIAKIAAQGDVLFIRVRSVPATAKLVPTSAQIVVAHSETGHHHSIDATDGVTMFRDPSDPLVCYLTLEGVEFVDLIHHRPYDTHETLRLLGTPGERSVFEVRRQREYTPEGWRRVED